MDVCLRYRIANARARPQQGLNLLLLCSAERYKQSARTSGGAEKWLDVRLFRSPTDAVTSAKRAGYQARTLPDGPLQLLRRGSRTAGSAGSFAAAPGTGHADVERAHGYKTTPQHRQQRLDRHRSQLDFKHCFDNAGRSLFEGTQVVATHLRADARDVRDIDWSVPTAVVLGNEREGVSSRHRASHVCMRLRNAVMHTDTARRAASAAPAGLCRAYICWLRPVAMVKIVTLAPWTVVLAIKPCPSE